MSEGIYEMEDVFPIILPEEGTGPVSGYSIAGDSPENPGNGSGE